MRDLGNSSMQLYRMSTMVCFFALKEQLRTCCSYFFFTRGISFIGIFVATYLPGSVLLIGKQSSVMHFSYVCTLLSQGNICNHFWGWLQWARQLVPVTSCHCPPNRRKKEDLMSYLRTRRSETFSWLEMWVGVFVLRVARLTNISLFSPVKSWSSASINLSCSESLGAEGRSLMPWSMFS